MLHHELEPGTYMPHPEHPIAPSRIVREVLVVYVAISVATFGLTRFAGDANVLVPLGVALLFLWVPLRLARRHPEGAARYGMSLGGLIDGPPPAQTGLLASIKDLAMTLAYGLPSALRETAFAAFAMLVVFPPYVFGFYFWHHEVLGITLHEFRFVLPDEFGPLLLTQLLVVGLPEEALFRGYMQSRLHEAWPPSRKLLGASLSVKVLLLQAFLFALLHVLVDGNLVRLAVFFPGLLFGWMRARRGGIGSAIVFHAFSNVLSETLAVNWLR